MLPSEIKMFLGNLTITMLTISNQVSINTSNSFLLSRRVAIRASIGIQYIIRKYINILTVILYNTAMRYINYYDWLRHYNLINK